MIPAFRNTVLFLCAVALLACSPKLPKHPSEAVSQETRIQMQKMAPEFLYLAAQNALKDGKRKLAVEFLSALVIKDPESIEPHIQLADLLMQLKRTKEAEREVAQLLKKELKEQDQEKLILTQVRLKVASNKQDEALDLLKTVLEKNPVSLPARNLQMRILADQKRIGEALAEVDKAILLEEKPEFRLLQAQLLLRQGDLKSAKVSLQRLRKLVPESETAVLMLSGIALNEKNSADAEKVLRDFLNTHPDSIAVNLELGKLMIRNNRTAEAILIYRALAQRTGDDPEVLKTLGMLYYRYNDFENSEHIFRKLHQNSASDLSTFYLAASLEALKQTEEARELYSQIDPKGKTGPEAQTRLATMELSDGYPKRAMARLHTLLKLKPKHTEAQLLRSVIRLSEKQYKAVIRETEPLLDSSDIHPQILFNRAVAFEQLKQYQNLEVTLTRLLTRHPKHSEAMNFLGYSYAIQGIKLERAEQLIQQALNLKPDDGYYLDSLAWVYYQRGNYKKALDTQYQALKRVDSDPVMYEHLGDILWRSGDSEGARRAWKQAIDAEPEDPNLLRKKILHGLESGH